MIRKGGVFGSLFRGIKERERWGIPAHGAWSWSDMEFTKSLLLGEDRKKNYFMFSETKASSIDSTTAKETEPFFQLLHVVVFFLSPPFKFLSLDFVRSKNTLSI